MVNPRAIVKRLKAVKNIRKITRTMELIATARFKKAMDRATEAAAYTRKMGELVADLSQSELKFSHPLLEKHDKVENAALLVLTSNRGLCGGYNAGTLKLAMQRLRELGTTSENLFLEVSGKRGLNFLRFQQIQVDRTHTNFEDRPSFAEVDVIAERYIQQYISGKLDRLDVAYVQFESVSRQTAVIETLLPVTSLATEEKSAKVNAEPEAKSDSNVEYEFLPSAEAILTEIVPASFKARMFKCFLDAAVCEQVFRMVAMKGATENAGEMISDLSRVYNRARQAQITSELSEIIGGAAALD